MGHRDPRPHRDTLPRPHSPRSPRCLDECRAFNACDASTQSVQFSPNFYYFYISLSVLTMYWAVLTVDCQNSVCRNRVCRTSVCLPCLSAADCVYNIWLLWGFAPSTPLGLCSWTPLGDFHPQPSCAHPTSKPCLCYCCNFELSSDRRPFIQK